MAQLSQKVTVMAIAIACTVAAIVMFSSFGFMPSATRVSADESCESITICHSTSSQTNPYNQLCVDDNSIMRPNGHATHTGPVFFPGITVSWGDIIPPFDGFSGLNWNAEGQAIFNGGCEYPDQVIDVCPNIAGAQETMPDGYHMDDSGSCVPDSEEPIDVCLNLDGIQEAVPAGYQLNDAGDCVVNTEEPFDACPNIENDQATVPVGYHVDEAGNCVVNVQDPIDVCLNLEGIQETVPAGLVKDAAGNCAAVQTGVSPTPTPTPTPTVSVAATTGIVAGATTATETKVEAADPAETTEQLALAEADSSDDSGSVLGASTLAPTGRSANYGIWAMLLGGCALLGLAAFSLVGKKS